MMRETAYAKINLALHVRGRRADGYHEIETLFAFVDAGDTIAATPADTDQIALTGEFADGLGDPFGNLALRALGVLPRPRGLALTLEKCLPVAAGLGGGSADAGAVFRLVDAYHGLPDDWAQRAARLGADVPACVASTTTIGRGTGVELTPVDSDLAGTSTLLVNPRIPLATAPVFAGWDGRDRGPLPEGSAAQIARTGRNDLEPSAIALCPEIGAVLDALLGTGAWLVRMSGSGATCFALYENPKERDVAAARIAGERPEWWQMSGALRP